MAYVIWRVFMKKYSRIRLGLNGPTVTPVGRHALTYDEESWRTEEKPPPQPHSEEMVPRCAEVRQSKTRRVKNYLKKCKNALGSRSNSSEQQANGEGRTSSSWYLEDGLNESEVHELDDVQFEDARISLDLGDLSGAYQVASIIQAHGGGEQAVPPDSFSPDFIPLNEDADASPLLTQEQEPVEARTPKDDDGPPCEGWQADASKTMQLSVVKSDVKHLVEQYFGDLYENFDQSQKCLVRQARDLLVCEYQGCLRRFENEFCTPAAKLLQHIVSAYSSSGATPSGWPLSLGAAGIVIHLGPLDPSLVRNRDCYLCIRARSAPGLEVALISRRSQRIESRTVAEFTQQEEIMCSRLASAADIDAPATDSADLPEMLRHLLVSVERAVERVPLDDLIAPCPQCLQYLPLEPPCAPEEAPCACQCRCQPPAAAAAAPDARPDALPLPASPMFEFAGPIPHIDSDDEDDKDSMRSGTSPRKSEIGRPSHITDLPEKLLMSGINLPGTSDTDGRPIILCYAECISRAGLNKYEIAKLLLYYTSIPTIKESNRGFTILLLAENETTNKVLELLDKSVYLIHAFVKVFRYLIWKPGCEKELNTTQTSQIQTIAVGDEVTLAQYLRRDQAPASCGGICNHDQLEWVEFFKQVEPFLAACKTAGHSLLTTLSQLRNEDVPHQVTRKFLNHQCRQIARALECDHVQKLRREGNKTLTNLKERSQWLSNSSDVKRSVTFAHSSFGAVDKVTKRLEQLRLERADRLKELAKFRTLQDEADELLVWIRKVGEDTLNNLALLLHTVKDVVGVKEVANDFEKFFFNAWRQIEKANDLAEECKNINDPRGHNLKEATKNLQNHMKSFRERLEDTRERLEDCSRCFLLLDSCHDILEDDGKEQEEFYKLAEKSGNEKLLQMCKNAKCKQLSLETYKNSSNKTISATSTPIKGQNTQIRRRSVSSLAYIYHCNHHANGELCNCYESDTENSVSYKLKKKYIQTLQQNCVCNTVKEPLERKGSATLDGIKEERESVEDILEKIETDCRRCDSGMSTTDNSVGDDSVCNKKKLQSICSCQYYRESCALCSAASSSGGSNHDNIDGQQFSINGEGSDGFVKSNSSEDIEEENYSEERRQVAPITANNHLYCHASDLDLPSDALYTNMDPKIQKTLTYIIKEMIETERDYVKSLDYVIVNYIPELMREDIPQALRGQRNIVFGNVEKIYEFHSQHFLGELEECEHNPLQVGQIFLKYDKRFYLYALYNKNKPKSDSLMSEYGSSFFKSKQVELNDKMDLASYLLKPVQRMGKYALLLQQMMKACAKSTSNPGILQELEDLKQAEEMVRFKLRHGNDLLAMDSIRDCDVNLKEQGSLLRQNEFLVWEGRSGKKSLRQVFLFEELILFSKARRFPDRKNLDLYIYKNSIKMTDIGLTAKIGDSPTKFEIWFRKRKPNDTYTLQGMSEDVKKAWTEELSQLLWKQAIRNRAIRMAEMSSMGIGNKPCLDIRPSADQISDRSISVDQLSRTAPRFRNSIVGPAVEACRTVKRPHSVISMSSVSSSSSSSGGSGGHNVGPNNSASLSCESTCESPKPYHRSATLNSQCSMESGIIADMSMGSDECSEQH